MHDDEKWSTYAKVINPVITIPESHKWEGSYEMELGKIEYTYIGLEDHGIFSWALGFHFGGTGQGTGHYNFTPEMLDVTKDVLSVVGCRTWEGLPGSPLYVIRNEKYGKIIGLANSVDPEFKWMFFPE